MRHKRTHLLVCFLVPCLPTHLDPIWVFFPQFLKEFEIYILINLYFLLIFPRPVSSLNSENNEIFHDLYLLQIVAHLITCMSHSPSRLFSVGSSSFIDSNTFPSSSPVAGSIPSKTASQSRQSHSLNISGE